MDDKGNETPRKQTTRGSAGRARSPPLPGIRRLHAQLLAAVVTVAALGAPPRGAVFVGFISAGATAHLDILLELGPTGRGLHGLLGGATGVGDKSGESVHAGSRKKLANERNVVSHGAQVVTSHRCPVAGIFLHLPLNERVSSGSLVGILFLSYSLSCRLP